MKEEPLGDSEKSLNEIFDAKNVKGGPFGIF